MNETYGILQCVCARIRGKGLASAWVRRYQIRRRHVHNFTYNAQQQPQSLWSRMWDVRLEHAGHCVRTSKLAGAVQPTGIGAGLPSTANAGLGLSTHVPIIFCTWATVMPSKRSLRPAVQPGDCGFN